VVGDDELTGEFERVMHGDAGQLRPTPVDLGELASHLDAANRVVVPCLR
jgi:hypothetical protein